MSKRELNVSEPENSTLAGLSFLVAGLGINMFFYHVLIVSILGYFGCFIYYATLLIAVILGIISICLIQESKGKLKGTGLAIAAIIIGIAGEIWFVLVTGIYYLKD